MMKKIWEKLSYFGKVFFLDSLVILLLVCLFDAGGILIGSGLMAMAVLTGVATCASLLFILLGMGPKLREPVLKVLAFLGFWLDAFLTVALFVACLHVGVTLALCSLMIGINFSGFLSILRVIYFSTHPKDKAKFLSTQHAKLVTA